jgi:inner membrane protein
MEKQTLFERFNNWVRNSVTLKLISIGILILILLIPTNMLSSLIYERQSLRDVAINEVSSKWGNAQTIGGPVLTIPYTFYTKDDKGTIERTTRYAHFLPDELKMDGKIIPEKRYRGIYVVVLYNSKVHISGKFSYPELKSFDIPISDYQFDKAFISVGITDMKGINDNINFNLNDSIYTLGPGLPSSDIFNSGAGFEFELGNKAAYTFDFDLNLNGSSSLSFLPFGKETNVSIESAWESPSFDGSFLPDSRSITEKGFKASWKVLQLNRNYPQQGLGSFISSQPMYELETNASDNYSAFGVKLLLPVDEYLKTTRSVKYCIMFIVLTFLSFFFIEILNKKRIHPIQYLLVGFAICLFYILLLSISEHLSFNIAYLIGSISILSIITFYAKFVFDNSKLTMIFSSLLALLYGFFYSLLQLEDYSLLLGSIGLFLILSTIMYLTRKIDWYNSRN